jgi:hypothetical protein
MSDLMNIYGGSDGVQQVSQHQMIPQPIQTEYQPAPINFSPHNPQLSPYLFNANGQSNAILEEPLSSILDGMNFDEVSDLQIGHALLSLGHFAIMGSGLSSNAYNSDRRSLPISL